MSTYLTRVPSPSARKNSSLAFGTVLPIGQGSVRKGPPALKTRSAVVPRFRQCGRRWKRCALGLINAPVDPGNFYPVLVLVVRGLALNPVDLQIPVDCHCYPQEDWTTDRTCFTGSCHRKAIRFASTYRVKAIEALHWLSLLKASPPSARRAARRNRLGITVTVERQTSAALCPYLHLSQQIKEEGEVEKTNTRAILV